VFRITGKLVLSKLLEDCARKLAVLLWHVLTSGEPFRYAQPKSLQAKYSRLRVRAAGILRRSGIFKGTSRSPQYGHGRTRALPSLPQVLAENGLPQPAASRQRGKSHAGTKALGHLLSRTADYFSRADKFVSSSNPGRRRRWNKRVDTNIGS
jgi:hypothetical protein